MRILGIETSCDETAAAVVSGDQDNLEVESSVVSSQVEIHQKYGGVVPEVAAREHVHNILPVINESLIQASIEKKRVSEELDIIAVANGPGLVTSLIVGVETAKSFALAWSLPLVGVNHIEGHIYSNFLEHVSDIEFPAVVLTVSGGHTMLILMKDHLDYDILGETKDDAAGEAFDKAAQLLDIGYPGGPAVARWADEFDQESDLEFPRPMLKNNDFDFSFSGLKTSLLYKIKADKKWPDRIPEYCYKFQEAVTDVLVQKTIRAAEKYRARTVMFAGGVSANRFLRQQFQQRLGDKLPDVNFFIPSLQYTTDNAAMVTVAGYYRACQGKTSDWQDITVNCNSEL